MYIVTYIQLDFDTKKSLLDPVHIERHILGYCETFEQGKEYVLKYHNGMHEFFGIQDYQSEEVTITENKKGFAKIKAEKCWQYETSEGTHRVEEQIMCSIVNELKADPFADIVDIYT